MAPTSGASHTEPTKSQYHHFIPRFILRNFVHATNQRQASSKQSPKGAKRWRKGGRNYNEPMIYAVDLSKPTAEIVERPVSRTFGITDMYRDLTNLRNEHYLEEELSKLESRVGEVVSKMRKHFEEGKADVWITRTERNTVRKFLFIMKYRSSRMHKRFYHQDAQEYFDNDKEKLLRYMDEKGFKTPSDVWFDNIKGMLDLKMDVKGDWIKEFPTRIYPDDAKWYIAHTQMMYLALCTPTNKDQEFLLTENAYGIYEGPSSVAKDPSTGKPLPTPYTEFHKFAVISPKLMMVLRSFLLPVPEEDFDDEMKRYRENMLKLNVDQHAVPSAAVSSLADLPITKPRNSYSRIVDGRLQLLEGRDGSHRVDDRFCFRFFPLETEHVNKINAIMLEESHSISNIVFKSHSGLRMAIDYYLTMPTTGGLKLCDGMHGEPRLGHLKKLERLVNEMGSSVTAVYNLLDQVLAEAELEKEEQMGEAFAKFFEESLPKKPNDFMQLYIKLGGVPRNIFKDMEQARRMVKMRIKIDVFTKGLEESFREGVREDLRELFCQLPPQRVWYYLKQIRNMLLGDKTISLNDRTATAIEADSIINGPEDSIARGSIPSPLFPDYVSQIFRNSTALCRLMWYSTLKNIDMIRHPDINFDTKITFDDEGGHRMNLQRQIFFGPLGSICNCGVLMIEEKAKFCKDMVRLMPHLEEIKNPFWKMEENIEMITRCMVRDGFADLMASKLSTGDVDLLEKVLFDVIYPAKF